MAAKHERILKHTSKHSNRVNQHMSSSLSPIWIGSKFRRKKLRESMNQCDGMHFETGNWFVLVFRYSDTFLLFFFGSWLKWNNQCHSLISNVNPFILSRECRAVHSYILKTRMKLNKKKNNQETDIIVISDENKISTDFTSSILFPVSHDYERFKTDPVSICLERYK